MKRASSIGPLAFALALFLSIGIGAAARVQQGQQKPPQAAVQGAATGRKPPAAESAATSAKTEAPAIEQPADFKAFNEASAEADPVKRIAALQKFIDDNPGSYLVTSARSQIKSQSLTLASEYSRKYLAAAEKVAQSPSGPSLVTCFSLANELNRSGVMLEKAEEYALKGLESRDAQKYIDEWRANQKSPSASDSKLPPNTAVTFSVSKRITTAKLVPRAERDRSSEMTDEDLRGMYNDTRTNLRNTLGQIYVKRGKTAEAEKLFKEIYADSTLDASSKTPAARELANFARKAGDDKALVEYLIAIVAAGARPDVRRELDDVYRKTHNGSLDGLEAALDERYAKLMPHIEVKPFVRPAAAGARVALGELFTGSECPPCVGADLAFDAALERFSSRDFTLLVYHQHVPGPDPMTNPSTEKRKAFYNVRGVPTFYVDGKTDGAGGGGASQAEGIFTKRLNPAIEKALATKPEAALNVTARMTGSTIKVKTAVSRIASTSSRLRLHIVLAEERLKFHGGNGIRFHPMVVRSVAGAGMSGFPVSAARGAQVSWTFDVRKIVADNRAWIDDFLAKPFRGGDKPTFSSRMDQIDPTHLVVVAFVQDEDQTQDGKRATTSGGEAADREVALRHVLQAASVRVGRPGTTN